jgi:hypothetical protein
VAGSSGTDQIPNAPVSADIADGERDPMSGYASADVLDSKGEPPPEEVNLLAPDLRDPMSGYMSLDVLDGASPVNQEGEHARDTTVKDPMSGYASADALDDEDLAQTGT